MVHVCNVFPPDELIVFLCFFPPVYFLHLFMLRHHLEEDGGSMFYNIVAWICALLSDAWIFYPKF